MIAFYFFLMNKADVLENGGYVRNISEAAFKKIKVGMTKEQVESLLGTQTIEETFNGSSYFKEYGYVSGVNQNGPSPKAYVVWFKDGKVEKKRKPIK